MLQRKAKGGQKQKMQKKKKVASLKEGSPVEENKEEEKLEEAEEAATEEIANVSTASSAKAQPTEQSQEVPNESECGAQSSADLSATVLKVRAQAEEAIDVLVQVADRSKGKMLFPEVDQVLEIQCIYKKPAATNPGMLKKKIFLPHAFHDDATTTVCLIMADLDYSDKGRRDPDVDKQARQWEDTLREEHGITKKHVHKILTMRQLEREYHTYIEKRQLASAYDLFVVDSRVAPNVWNKCGKEFYKKRKMPVSVDLEKGKLAEQIKKAYSLIYLPLSGNRTRTTLHIGHLGQSKSDLADNIQEAITRLFEYCPGGIPNVRSLYLRISSGGPTLPIYVDTGSANAIQLAKPKKQRKEIEATMEEITTLPEGLAVKVRRHGKVQVVNAETKKPVVYPTRDDEWEERDDIKPVDAEKVAQKKETKKRKARFNKKQRESKKRKAAAIGGLKNAFATIAATATEGSNLAKPAEKKPIKKKSQASDGATKAKRTKV